MELSTTIMVPYTIPFYSKIVSKKNDMDGFKTLQHALFWEKRGCGIVSLRMVVDGLCMKMNLPLSGSYAEMVYKGVNLKAYRDDVGWIHAGLVRLAEEYGINGYSFRGMTVVDILEDLKNGRPCIASVSEEFKGGVKLDNGRFVKPGGHLVVVLGSVMNDGFLTGLIVHHPSDLEESNWENQFVPLDDFTNSFSGNYMHFYIS